MGPRFASFVVGAVLIAVALPALAVVETMPGEEMAAAAPAGSVARATFTSGIVEREPQDSVEGLTNDHVQVYFFTELRDMQGRTIIHRWMWNGQVMGEVAFDVAGPRWRVHSSKNLEPSWLGEWTVMVVDAEGNQITESHFSYSAVDAPEAPDAAVPAPANMD